MTQPLLAILSDIATEAHSRIQQDYVDINPIVGVSRNMRKSGIPADAMTIDCLKTNKRIILILHDEQPDIIRYQFSFRDKDPAQDFELMKFNLVTAQTIYDWIKGYFSKDSN